MSAVVSLQIADSKTAYFTGNTFAYKDMIRAIPGSKWEKKPKRWEIPLESVGDAVRIFPSLVVTDEVKAAFGSLKKRNQQAVAVKHTKDFNTVKVQHINGLKGKPRPYQQVSHDFLCTLEDGEGKVLALDMGLGKSFVGLAYFQHLKNLGIVDNLLVVCPAPLKYSIWAKEIKKFTNFEYMVIDGEKTEAVEWDDGTVEKMTGKTLREVQYQQAEFGVPIMVMNYELFLYDGPTDKWALERPLTPDEQAVFLKAAAEANAFIGNEPEHADGIKSAIQQLLPQFVKPAKNRTIKKNGLGYGIFQKQKAVSILPKIDGRWLVVLDEAHRIKNPKATTTKNLIDQLAPAGRKVLGTGTPLENNIQELWSLMDFCRPGILGNYYKFLDRYVEMDYFGNPIAPKPQMMPELRERIAPLMLRITKAEALPDLPPLVPVDYGVQMTKAQRKLYNAVKEGILQNLKTGEFTYMEVIVQITRLQQVVDSPALLRKLLDDPSLPEESGKLNQLKDVLDDMNWKENKFILFSQYKEMTDILYKWLQEVAGLPKEAIGYVKGGTRSTEYDRVSRGFQDKQWGEPGNIQCVLMTTAGNYGLDLSKCRYVICYDQLFNPQKMAQILSRGHRSGNVTGVTAITLTTQDSYEQKKQDILEKKRELFAAFVDESDEAFVKLFSKQELMNML